MFTQGGGVDKVSVLIRCKNEERWIGHAIQSAIDFFPDCQIVINDNHSTDDSMEIVKMFETWHDIEMLTIDDYSPGRSLNQAVERAKYDKILILSSHCVIKEFDYDVFNRLEYYVAVFGKQIPIYRGRKINKRYIWSHFVDNDEVVNMHSEIENRYFLHNAFCIYDKKVLLENKFDEHLFGKEDRYWAKDMVEGGKNFLYSPDMVCEHHWTPNGATWKGIG